MIHGKSDHPALIKKIALNVWTLRDEIEAVIKSRVLNGESIESISVAQIEAEYLSSDGVVNPSPSIQIPTSLQAAPTLLDTSIPLDDSEDEMAKALREIQAADGAPTEAEGAATEDDMLKAMQTSTEESPATEDDMLKAMQEITPSAPAAPTLSLAPATNLAGQIDETELKIYQRSPVIDPTSVINGVAILSEIDINQLLFFIDHPVVEGQTIIIDFLIPNRFKLLAEVIYCRQYSMRTRIIREREFNYRIAAKFMLKKRGERTLLRQFLKSIEPDLTHAGKKSTTVTPEAGAPKAESASSAFDELDDLDL